MIDFTRHKQFAYQVERKPPIFRVTARCTASSPRHLRFNNYLHFCVLPMSFECFIFEGQKASKILVTRGNGQNFSIFDINKYDQPQFRHFEKGQ